MTDTDKDRIEGGFDKAKGSVKEEIGELRGDDRQVAEGQRDQAMGGLKQTIADVRDKISGLFNKDKR